MREHDEGDAAGECAPLRDGVSGEQAGSYYVAVDEEGTEAVEEQAGVAHARFAEQPLAARQRDEAHTDAGANDGGGIVVPEFGHDDDLGEFFPGHGAN